MEESSKVAKLWTLRIVGNEPFQASVAGNPTVLHVGGMSVINLMLNEDQAMNLTSAIRAAGCEVDVWPVPGQSKAQTKLREDRLKVVDIVDLPCAECPGCPWLEPWSDEACGFVGLPPESTRQLLLTSEPHRKALLDCPVA